MPSPSILPRLDDERGIQGGRTLFLRIQLWIRGYHGSPHDPERFLSKGQALTSACFHVHTPRHGLHDRSDSRYIYVLVGSSLRCRFSPSVQMRSTYSRTLASGTSRASTQGPTIPEAKSPLCLLSPVECG